MIPSVKRSIKGRTQRRISLRASQRNGSGRLYRGEEPAANPGDSRGALSGNDKFNSHAMLMDSFGGKPEHDQKHLVAALMSLSLFAQGPGRGIPDLSGPQTSGAHPDDGGARAADGGGDQARAELDRSRVRRARNEAAIQAKAEAVDAAELALANARADLFAKLQASPAKLAPNQVAALIAAGGMFRGAQAGRGGLPAGGRGTIPDIRQAQTDALTRMTTDQCPWHTR